MLVCRQYTKLLVVIGLTALAVAVALGQPGPASAHTPHAGLDFSFAVDTNGDTVAECGTDVGQAAKCTASLGSIMQVRVYLNSLGVPAYRGFDIQVDYTGVTSKGNPSSEYYHPNCATPVQAHDRGWIAWGCAEFAPPAPDPAYLGLIGTVDFTCTASGTLTLLHGGNVLGTAIATSDSASHAEGDNIGETLTINCVEAPPVGGISSDVLEGETSRFPFRSVGIASTLVLVMTMLGFTLRRQRV